MDEIETLNLLQMVWSFKDFRLYVWDCVLLWKVEFALSAENSIFLEEQERYWPSIRFLFYWFLLNWEDFMRIIFIKFNYHQFI